MTFAKTTNTLNDEEAESDESESERFKNISQLDHGRHRSATGCFVNLPGGLVAYTRQEKKPGLNIRVKEQLQLVF